MASPRILLPTAKPHILRPTHPAHLPKKLAAGQPFDYPATLVGATPDGLVTVYYATSLGQPGADLGAQMFASAPKTYADCAAFFGMAGNPINLIVAPLSGSNDGTGGAYHYGCDFTSGGDLYIDAAFGNPTMDIGLFVAELTECFMGAQNMGWNCGGSGGEALSRLLAEIESGGPDGALAGFASAPAWDQASRPDWIDSDQGTDQDYPSIGCGMVYFSWMLSLGYTPDQITQAGEPSGTLASNYQALTGKATAWADFSAAVATLAGPITNDDPFGAQPRPQLAATPPPRRAVSHAPARALGGQLGAGPRPQRKRKASAARSHV